MSTVDVRRDVVDVTPGVIALRRDLHRHPELAFEEFRTSATLADRMVALGLPVHTLGGTGVLAILDGPRPGRTLLIRADIDGLAMPDATGAVYASEIADRSHACGHDAHAAMVVGVAEVLARHRARIAGRIAFVFQPADEPMRGARRMIEDGLLELARPDMSMAVHVLPMANVGEAVVQTGPLWASRDELTLRIEGAPRAAAFDLARTAASVTTALYELVEKEGRSTDPVTFRVRSMRAEQGGPVWLGGPTTGPDHADIQVNLALHDAALRPHLLGRIEEISRTIVVTAGGTLRIGADYALPVVENDRHVTGALARAAEIVIGQANILTGWRHPFSDDFGLFLTAAPGCLVLLGTANPAKGLTEIWHRPGFDLDEDALPVGVEIMSLAALELLR